MHTILMNDCYVGIVYLYTLSLCSMSYGYGGHRWLMRRVKSRNICVTFTTSQPSDDKIPPEKANKFILNGNR